MTCVLHFYPARVTHSQQESKRYNQGYIVPIKNYSRRPDKMKIDIYGQPKDFYDTISDQCK